MISAKNISFFALCNYLRFSVIFAQRNNYRKKQQMFTFFVPQLWYLCLCYWWCCWCDTRVSDINMLLMISLGQMDLGFLIVIVIVAYDPMLLRLFWCCCCLLPLLLREAPTKQNAKGIWALPVWGGVGGSNGYLLDFEGGLTLNPCQDGLGHLCSENWS